MITKLELNYFTAFKHLSLEFSPGVNLFVGTNGTGKTHLLKLLYTALSSSDAPEPRKRAFEDKLINVFLPMERRIGRLTHRINEGITCQIRIYKDTQILRVEFTGHAKESVKVYRNMWLHDGTNGTVGTAVYIPVKEMLADAPGFRSLYEQHAIHTEEVYYDILSKAFFPILRGPMTQERKKLLTTLQNVMEGKVVTKDEQFFLKNQQGELEFTLLAEGVRKFGLLWLLIQNGTFLKGTTLFWDEPEANLNPSMIKTLVEILLQLQRQGVQIFIATHSYVVLKEFDLQAKAPNQLRFFLLQRDPERGIHYEVGNTYQDILPNPIDDAYTAIYDKEIERSLGI